MRPESWFVKTADCHTATETAYVDQNRSRDTDEVSIVAVGRECPPKHCLAPTHRTTARPWFQTMIWSETSVQGPFRRPSTERGIWACGGVPGTALCPIDHPVSVTSRTMPYRAPTESASVFGSPGYEAGRRRAIGVVAALPINPRATTPMARRWSAGTPKRHSGPEGRD